MNNEAKKAAEMAKDIRALATKYKGQEHLSGFVMDLENLADELDCVIEDTEDVE